MERSHPRKISTWVAIIAGLFVLLLGYWLPQGAHASNLYVLQVTPTSPDSAIEVLDQVKAQVSEAYLTYEGDLPLITVGQYESLRLADQQQAMLQDQGLSAALLQQKDGRLQPVDQLLLMETESTHAHQKEVARLESNSLFPWFPYHFPYDVVVSSLLQPLRGHRGVLLHQDAAQAFHSMQTAAQKQGIRLLPLSGFRNLSVQTMLFRRQIARRGSEAAARRLSAPPGHSEHHTGFAIDIGDSQYPATHVQYSFDQTPSFQWLQDHAHEYGFQLSIPAQNLQGISYEPWHWRFVQSAEAQSIFAQALHIQEQVGARLDS